MRTVPKAASLLSSSSQRRVVIIVVAKCSDRRQCAATYEEMPLPTCPAASAGKGSQDWSMAGGEAVNNAHLALLIRALARCYRSIWEDALGTGATVRARVLSPIGSPAWQRRDRPRSRRWRNAMCCRPRRRPRPSERPPGVASYDDAGRWARRSPDDCHSWATASTSSRPRWPAMATGRSLHRAVAAGIVDTANHGDCDAASQRPVCGERNACAAGEWALTLTRPSDGVETTSGVLAKPLKRWAIGEEDDRKTADHREDARSRPSWRGGPLLVPRAARASIVSRVHKALGDKK